MMTEESLPNQGEALLKRTKKHAFFLFGFILLVIFFGCYLVTSESPEKWKEADITITEIQYIYGKSSRWQITDTQGNTYAISSSNKKANQIVPGSTYHVVYSPNAHHGIRSMTQADLVIVDYEQSVSEYGERGIWVWILFFVGLIGALGTIGRMILNLRRFCKAAQAAAISDSE